MSSVDINDVVDDVSNDDDDDDDDDDDVMFQRVVNGLL